MSLCADNHSMYNTPLIRFEWSRWGLCTRAITRKCAVCRLSRLYLINRTAIVEPVDRPRSAPSRLYAAPMNKNLCSLRNRVTLYPVTWRILRRPNRSSISHGNIGDSGTERPFKESFVRVIAARQITQQGKSLRYYVLAASSMEKFQQHRSNSLNLRFRSKVHESSNFYILKIYMRQEILISRRGQSRSLSRTSRCSVGFPRRQC